MTSELHGLCDLARRRRAVGEFEEWEFVLVHHRRRVAEIDRTDEFALSKELARREVTLSLAQGLHVTESRVWAMISDASTLTERTPGVWAAFRVGDIDSARAAAIADTAERLKDPANWARLDHTAPGYAAEHTVGELRVWLRRFRARVEAEQVAVETARAESVVE